jgi:hypothetical protein
MDKGLEGWIVICNKKGWKDGGIGGYMDGRVDR